jgi:hypothetical protein
LLRNKSNFTGGWLPIADLCVTPGKRGTSAALGCRPTMNSSPFPQWGAPASEAARRSVSLWRQDGGAVTLQK